MASDPQFYPESDITPGAERFQSGTIANANRKPEYLNEIGLLDRIGNLVRAYNKVVYPDDTTKHIEYVAAYPEYIFDYTNESSMENRPTKLIAYDIIRKDSGSLGTRKFDKTKRVRPVLIESRNPVIVDAGLPTERTITQNFYVKPYDLEIRFDCLAGSDRESMYLIHTFEKLMEAHAMYIERGAQRFIYDGRTPSFFNKNTKYKSRSCKFFAQVQEIWVSDEDRIADINYTVGMTTNPSDTFLTSASEQQT